jgi:hypothetical protein
VIVRRIKRKRVQANRFKHRFAAILPIHFISASQAILTMEQASGEL